MKEIKFRAWDKKHNRMFNVYGIGKDFVTEDTMDGIDPGINCFGGEEFHKNIDVMQFTGLKDKNGKEVYELDICKFNKDPEEYIFFHGLALMDDKYIGGSWKIIRCDNVHPEIPELKGKEILDSTSFWNDDYEVIGNIYENPELLNQ